MSTNRFHFRAITRTGEPRAGELEAADRARVVTLLQAQDLIPIEVSESYAASGVLLQPRPSERPLPLPALTEFTEQLGILLKSDIAIDRALELVAMSNPGEGGANLLNSLRTQIRAGASLSQACAQFPGSFPPDYVALIQAGEATGALDDVLRRLGEQLRRSVNLRESIRSSLTYPAILLAVTLISVLVVLVFVLPRFEAVFSQANVPLPLSTRLVLGTGGLVRDWGWLLALGTLGIGGGGWFVASSPRGRRQLDTMLLNYPRIGGVVVPLELARYGRTLGFLIDCGIPLLEALRLSRPVIRNSKLREFIESASETVREGQSVAASFAKISCIPLQFLQMVKIGEERGQLGEMLLHVADLYSHQVQVIAARALRLLEPVTILLLSVVVGGVVYALLVAVLGLSDIPL